MQTWLVTIAGETELAVLADSPASAARLVSEEIIRASRLRVRPAPPALADAVVGAKPKDRVRLLQRHGNPTWYGGHSPRGASCPGVRRSSGPHRRVHQRHCGEHAPPVARASASSSTTSLACGKILPGFCCKKGRRHRGRSPAVRRRQEDTNVGKRRFGQVRMQSYNWWVSA